MSDAELRALERAARLGDPDAVRAFRVALVRAGRGAEAGFRVGDHVEFDALVAANPELDAAVRAAVRRYIERGTDADAAIIRQRLPEKFRGRVVRYVPAARRLHVVTEDGVAFHLDLAPESRDARDGRADPPSVVLLVPA